MAVIKIDMEFDEASCRFKRFDYYLCEVYCLLWPGEMCRGQCRDRANKTGKET